MAEWVWQLCLSSQFTAADYAAAATDGKAALELDPDLYGSFYPARGRPPRTAGVAPNDIRWFAVAVRSGVTFTPPTGMAANSEIPFETYYGL